MKGYIISKEYFLITRTSHSICTLQFVCFLEKKEKLKYKDDQAA